MKLKSLLATATLLATMTTAAIAETYHDITRAYLNNAGFDTNFNYDASATDNVTKEILIPEGWTKSFTVTYNVTGVYQFGTKATFNGVAVPATGSDGTATGGGLVLSTYSSQSMRFYQNVVLSPGEYAIVTASYNCAEATAGSSLLCWTNTDTSESVTSTLAEFPSGKWVNDTVRFTVTEKANGRIQVGFKANTGGQSNSAKIIVDYVKLMRTTPYNVEDFDAYATSVNKLVNDATDIVVNNPGNEVGKLEESVMKAQADIAYARQMFVENPEQSLATVDQVKEEMEKALDDYSWANPTGAIPTVTTNARYARGATMAFGRLTVAANGSTVTERGFCWSEHPNPTINDNRTTKTLAGSSGSGVSGTMYWLQDLKPATMYYMRAYAITSGLQVGYGNVIKFSTIPKGQIKLQMRDGGSQDVYNRIKQASEDAIDYWNNLTEMKGFSPSIGFVDGTPTADCSYGGYIRVGSNTSYQRTGTILHEMLHGVGVIPWADTEWSRHNLRSGVNGDGYGTGYWLGDRTTEVVRFLQNSNTAQLNGDYQHMWPFGINGASEDTGEQVLYIANGLVCQALGEDGLQHTSSLFAEPYYSLPQEDGVKYYLKNESEDRGLLSSYLIPKADGSLTWREMTTEEAAANDSAAWYISFTPSNQYYQLRNASTGNYLTSSFSTVARESGATSTDNFHLMPGREDVVMGSATVAKRGYWIVRPRSNWTPTCLQANANGAIGSGTFNIASTSKDQRWVIMTIEEAMAIEQQAVLAQVASLDQAITQAQALLSVPHIEDVENADDNFTTTLKDIRMKISESSTITDIATAIDQVNAATVLFLSQVTATDKSQPFDLTYLLKNPGMDSTDGWNGTMPTLNYSSGEFYEKTFDFNQTVANLPSGSYQFRVQGYQRPGSSTDSWTAYQAGTDNVTAYLYAGNDSKQLVNICSDAQTKKLGGSESTVGTSNYIPNNMQAASIYFSKKLYDNSLDTTLDNNGSLKLGVRCTKSDSYYWTIFDNFRLYYFGHPKKGDINGDGRVSVADIVTVANFIAGETNGHSVADIDVNGDERISVADIVSIANIIAGGEIVEQ